MADKDIKAALEQFAHSQAASSFNREDALRDIEFARLGKQWPDEVSRQRQLEGRPCLVINRMPSFIRQVVNDSRQNKPTISVHPGDGTGDYDTAQIIGGLIRSIERNSNAALAYDTAIDHAVTGGFGFFRITTDYAHERSFDMEARIERVANPFSVHWDVSTTAFDSSDWAYAFVSDFLTEAEFKKKYPKAKPVSFEGGRGDDMQAWIAEGKVRIAEHWVRTEEKEKIILMSDGRVFEEEDFKKPVEIIPGVMLPMLEALAMQGITPARERMATCYDVKRRMMSGVEVLEESDWPGETIPICPVWGEEVIYNGKRHFRSLIRDAMDPQRMLNFWRTASTELVALAPRAPFMVAKHTIAAEDREAWRTANTRSHAYLEYDAKMGPAPQRQMFAGVPAGALQEALNASDDMKATTGMFDASLGARGNETSGRAIMARQRESDTGTFHFIDNLSRAIQGAGRILVEVIPSTYSERQTINILGEDDQQKVVNLVQRSGEAPSEDDPNGRLYDLSTGRYAVTVKTGPAYGTQREEAANAIMELIRAAPQSALVLGDIMVKNMDWPQADEAAKRIQMLQQIELQKMMPPQAPPAPGGPQMGAPPMPQGPGNVPPG